jgi:hypothetical protein
MELTGTSSNGCGTASATSTSGRHGPKDRRVAALQSRAETRVLVGFV